MFYRFFFSFLHLPGWTDPIAMCFKSKAIVNSIVFAEQLYIIAIRVNDEYDTIFPLLDSYKLNGRCTTNVCDEGFGRMT